MTRHKNRTGRSLGFIAATISGIFAKTPRKLRADEMGKSEFKTSTQKLGVRFTERIRNIYRHKWLKKN